MKKNNVGNFVIVLLAIITVLVWIVLPPQPSAVENYLRYHVGMIVGSLMIVLMSFSLFISTRPKWAEPYFGGLDKMYMTHRHTSTAAFLLMFVHIFIVPINIAGFGLGNYLGIVAFFCLVAIVLPTLAPRIPFLNKLTGQTYEGWKRLHKFVGIFFILGYIHSITVKAPGSPAINWNQIFVFLGIGSYLYTEIFGQFFKKYVPYIVEAVKHPNGSTTEVTLRAKGEPIKHSHAGQFMFVRFSGDKILSESHPFTISSAPAEEVLRLTIKASGDYTRHLFDSLKEGSEATIEGAYGLFNYKTGGEKQIWIAGGIGVTPFLSFLRDLKKDGMKEDVHFYYTVRHPEEAIFADEINTIAKAHPNLKSKIRFSSVHGSLKVDEIVKNTGGDVSKHHIYMCGPLPMVQAFEKSFLEAGVPAQQIHYEEFNFR
jgi:predicted ferric reductase